MSMSRSSVSTLAVLIAGVTLGIVLNSSPAWAAESDTLPAARYQKDVSDAFGLYDCDVARLDVQHDAGPAFAQQFVVPFDGESYELDIYPHSVRSPNYNVLYQMPDGTYESVEPGPVTTIRGIVVGQPGSTVAGGFGENGLSAVVSLADGSRFWFEPVAQKVAAQNARDYVIYAEEDAIPSGKSCGAEALHTIVPAGGEPEGQPPEGFGCNGDICVAELAIDSDVEFSNDWGGGVEARVNNIISAMNQPYEMQTGISHQISTIIVRPNEPDPYGDNITSSGQMLSAFQSHWVSQQGNVQRDVAQMFSGKNLGSSPGVAWRSTVCDLGLFGAYNVVESDCCGAGFNGAVNISAHELGHSWSAQHCGPVGGCDPGSFPPGGCSCPSTIMRCTVSTATTFDDSCSSPSIIAFRNSRTCLSDLAPMTTFPFSDTFPTAPIDPIKWLVEGATAVNFGANEPSAPLSMQITGPTRATTGFLDASNIEYVGLEYWWQRSGSFGPGGSPEPGEDLLIEVNTGGGQFEEVQRHLGAGPDDSPYERVCILLPPELSHESLQVRFRMTSGGAGDRFFIDDVSFADGHAFLGIVDQPQSDQTCIGGTADFSVLADGESPFSYQWQLDGTNIPGANDASLQISPVQAEDFGMYSVIVSNGCGDVASTQAPLIEVSEVMITTQPQNQSISAGSTLFLTVTASGSTGLQWFFNDNPIPDATSSFLFISNVQCADQGCYHVVAGNDCSELTSEVAEVTIDGGCGPLNCEDSTPPAIIHGSGLTGETVPYSGYIDPRRESSNGVDFNEGIAQTTILFNKPVESVGGGALSPADFVVTETGGGTPPTVTAVDDSQMPLVVLTFDRPITVQEYTTVQAVVQDTLDPPTVINNAGNQGPGVDEADRVDIGFLPADVDQDGQAGPFDLLRFRQIVNDQFTPTQGVQADFVDMDRDAAVGPFDLLAFRQLVNGVTPSTQSWATQSLNNARP